MCVTLAMLRRHINPLESPLYRLPPDLFPGIALHCASETDLVNVTHVSYHLRNALLSYPSLWSYLDFRNETRARAFFERTGRTLLYVDMPMDTTQMAGSSTELHQQSERIATLKLRSWSLQSAFLSVPLPSLRRLEISYQYYDYSDWDEDENREIDWASVWDPKEAASWSFPSLASLTLHNLIPTPFYAPHLTCFKFWDQASATNTDGLLNFLDNYPLLEHIDISYGGRFRSKQDLAVSLPNLRTYTETTFDGEYSLTVLNKLSHPPSCSVTLKFWNGGMVAKADDILPDFKNRDYLVEIKRVKFRAMDDAGGNEVVGALEFVNAKGTRLCSERMNLEKKGCRPHSKNYPLNRMHLNFLKKIDGRSVEILCIDGCSQRDVAAVEFLKEGLGFVNVRMLILSRSAVGPCLSALNEDLGADGHSQWISSIHTLVIHPDSDPPLYLRNQLSRQLISIAQKRKVAGFPFGFVSLFLQDGPGWGWDEDSELKLRECVEKLEVVRGDDVLDWDVDKYFLDGLDHLQKIRDVQWDQEGMYH